MNTIEFSESSKNKILEITNIYFDNHQDAKKFMIKNIEDNSCDEIKSICEDILKNHQC